MFKGILITRDDSGYQARLQDIDEAVLANVLFERFYSPDSFPSATLIMEGGGIHAPGWQLHYAGSALDNPDFPLEAGSLQFWLPRSFFSARRAEVLDFLSDATVRLPASCGTVSRSSGRKIRSVAWPR